MLNAFLTQRAAFSWQLCQLLTDNEQRSDNFRRVPTVCTTRDDQTTQRNLAMCICTAVHFALLEFHPAALALLFAFGQQQLGLFFRQCAHHPFKF
ncbi:hypothetical protein A7X57_13985 [Stenotrophomonas maltophilia]|nr:hypothetical protein A7X57_13985 [Stenotrophomonas maltophilia]